MDINKLKRYCQLCLHEQIPDMPLVTFSRDLRENFEEFTQKKPNITLFSEFICVPCFHEFESAVAYRVTLLDNQNALEELFKKSMSTFEEIIEEEIKIEEQVEFKIEEQIEIEEHLEEMMDDDTANDQEFVDADAGSEEDLPMAMDGEEEFSSIEVEGIDDSSMFRKRYPKKKLLNPISCPKCDRQFYYKAYFKFHYKDVHREDREEVCPYCGKVFKNSRRLNSHLLIHQTNVDKKYKCDQCEKQFNFSGDLNRHKRVHGNIKPYHCLLCPKSFTQSYALKLHMNVHSKVRFSCDFCAAEFSSKPTLKRHLIKCLNGNAVSRSRREFSKFEECEKERYKCFSEGCDRKFSSRKYLGVHLEKAHDLKFDNFEKTCLECQLSFDTVGDYSVHVKTHSCNFICEFCKLRFRTDAKLQTHLNKSHKGGEDRPFICPEQECGARFKRAEHLRGHQLYKHSDERKFECNLCSLKFRQRGEFNVHMRVHSNTKPFNCWQCDHVCKTSSNLRQHMKLVHDEDCIYFCQACQKTFKYNADLTQHKKGHASSNDILTVEILDTNE